MYVFEGVGRGLWDVCVALCGCSRAVCVASQRQGQGSTYHRGEVWHIMTSVGFYRVYAHGVTKTSVIKTMSPMLACQQYYKHKRDKIR